MGSREEFKSAVEFIDKHKIRPVVSTVLDGLEQAEEGFEIMKRGGQFGKVSVAVLRILSRELTVRVRL
jgi:NADPH:quinone reductase-like Zn-dependent oxidoreductase